MANINPNEQQSQTQCAMILAHLQKGYSLTGLQALDMFGCMRLPSRVNDLKNRGYNIQKRMIVTDSGKRVADYFIPK